MPQGESNFIQSIVNLFPLALFSLIGGLIDYFYAVQLGNRVWSIASFMLHLACSIFFGYLVALGMIGMGYPVEVAGAAAGAAGFLNIRVIDLLIYIAKKKYGAGNDCSK